MLTLLAAVLCWGVAPAAHAQLKIGTVNLGKIFDSYWKRNQADTQLKDRRTEFEKQQKELFDGYQKSNEEYQKLLDTANDQAISTEERDKRKKSAESKLREIKEMETQIQQFNRTAQTTLGEQTRRMRDAILREILEVVDTKSKAGGYTLVLDSSARTVVNTPFVAFTNGQNDLSDEVIAQLNANAPAEFLKPVEGGTSLTDTNNPAAPTNR